MLTIEERLARLEKATEDKSGEARATQSKPEPRFDPTAQLTVPASVTRDMAAAVGDKLMKDIVRDHLGRPTSLPVVPSRSPGKAGSNWAEPKPLPQWGGENFGKKGTSKDS